MIKIKVIKKNETLEVLLLKHKGTTTYSFVNLTKGHICSCVFDSIEDAMADLDLRKKQGLLVDYIIETKQK